MIILRADLFGQLQIVYHGVALTEDMIRSEMVTKLLACLLLHRERAMTVRELSDMLWHDDNVSDNPAGALKNLMYRLRTILKKFFGEEVQFVTTNLGSYCWNQEIPVETDIDLFEQRIKTAKETSDINKAQSYFEEAIALYKGHFLDDYGTEQWVVPIATYYRSMFLHVAKALAEIYEKKQNYEEMERISLQAIRYDDLDEELYCLALKAMVYQNNQSYALEYYEKIVKIFYDNLGIRKLNKLEEVHKEILSMKKVSDAVDMKEINQGIREENRPEGAYICGYAVFQELYRIEARRIGRMGMAEYVLLLTLSTGQSAQMEESAQRYMLNRAMDRMENVLQKSLRVGDVAARYSDSQFVVMLPACTYESGKMIAERIRKDFGNDKKNNRYMVQYNIEEITVAETRIMGKRENVKNGK